MSGALRSEQALRMGVLPAPYQELFEINKGTQSITVAFKGAQRQFEWLEISLIYDKSFQHLTIYDSYDLEPATKLIQKIKFQNTMSTYSVTGKIEYNQTNHDEKKIIYQIFVAYNCNGYSTAPLTQYKNNPIYREITPEEDFGVNARDDRIYLDRRRS